MKNIPYTNSKLINISNSKLKVVNVFVHGLMKNKIQYDNIPKFIKKSGIKGKNYFLKWNSGIPMEYSKGFIKAEIVGCKLLNKLKNSVKDLEKHRVNLYGHSAGTIVIAKALESNWKNYNLDSIIFMAGAYDLNKFKYYSYSNIYKVARKIINVYSEDDGVLFVLDIPVLGNNSKPIGNREVDLKSIKIMNYELNIGHSEHWENLDNIYKSIYNYMRYFYEKRFYFVKCPNKTCSNTLIVAFKRKNYCPFCNKYFTYNKTRKKYVIHRHLM